MAHLLNSCKKNLSLQVKNDVIKKSCSSIPVFRFLNRRHYTRVLRALVQPNAFEKLLFSFWGLRTHCRNISMESTVDFKNCNGVEENVSDTIREYGPNLKILPPNDQIKELQTIIRDKTTSRSDFKFYADRLIRLVIEESLNQLPFSKCEVVTPTGAVYQGLKYKKGNCGVSIIRSGEAMEQGLRDCCRSIRIGKILVESDIDTHEAKVVYARFPDDIADRKVLLMYPIMGTGNTVSKAVAVLKEHNVSEENIILSNLFCTPSAAKSLTSEFPDMTILTSEIYPLAPNHFGQKYFGTD